MYEVSQGAVPVRMEILNMLSSTSAEASAMQSYSFVSTPLVRSLESAADQVRREIETKIERREDSLHRLREQEKELNEINGSNSALRKQLEELRKELISLTA